MDYKYVRTKLFGRAPNMWYDTVFGLRVLRLTAEINRKTGRCDKSLKALSKANADTVILSEDFPSRGQFRVREPKLTGVYEKLLPRIIECHDLRGETALLIAGAGPCSVDMLRLLAQRYRYVITRGIPRTELERLQRVAGASVVAEPAEKKIEKAELAVLLRRSEPVELPAHCIMLTADKRNAEYAEYSKYIELPELDAPGHTPPGFDRQLLLSEALRRGALPLERLVVGYSQILTKLHK